MNVIPESVDVERVHYELKDRPLHVTQAKTHGHGIAEYCRGVDAVHRCTIEFGNTLTS